MPEIPELHLPPAAIQNAKQAIHWLASAPRCCPDLTALCDTCARMVAEAVALGLVGGGGYRLQRDGRILPPAGRTVAQREVVPISPPGLPPVLVRDPYAASETKAGGT